MFNKLCELNTLFEAWKAVKAKNSAGGIDGLSVLAFDENLRENLEQLQHELKSGAWNPAPYLQMEIKKNKTEKRKLGLLSVKDKIVQQTIKTLIEPRFENLFFNNSYGYRPDRGHFKAVRRSANEINQKKNQWIVQLDINDYFDSINHEILFSRLQHVVSDKEIRRLIELSVKMGMVNRRMKWSDATEGVPQGAVLSPLLANFYLHPFDQFVTSHTESYIRYADDFIILVQTEEQAKQIDEKAAAFLESRLKLSLNKPFMGETKNGVEFLGVVLQPHMISISDEKKKKLLERINSIQIEGGRFTQKSIEALEGIKQYYARLLPQQMLIPLDECLTEKINELIRNNYRNISGKKALEWLFARIPFFSAQYELNKKKQMSAWVQLYAQCKQKKNEHRPVSEKNKKLILQKKREYRKRENENTELVISTSGSFIARNHQGICVKIRGKQVDKQPLHALQHITVMAPGVSVSNAAVQYCMERKIPIDFFDYSGKLYASILSPVFVEQSVWQKQATMAVGRKASFAACIVRGKLKNQQNLIKYFHKYHKEGPELQKRYDEAKEKIDSLIEKTKKIDIQNEKYAEVLMSYESAGAIAYWAYVRQLFADDDVEFESRIRQGATDLFNSLLNYGYAIMYARVWQALLAAKLNPGIGVLHAFQKDKPTLVFDVMELFRAQAVDRVVIGMIQKHEPLEMKDGLLSEATKKLLIQNILERLNRYEKFRQKEMTFATIIKTQAKEMAQFIVNEKKVLNPT